MAEHLIRLRAGWEGRVGLGEPQRVDLPTCWPEDLREPVRLARRFGSPRVDPGCESLVLRLEQVAGLQRVWLNGQRLSGSTREPARLEIPLPVPLPPRNLLELEAEPYTGVSEDEVWGTIALVIRTHERESNVGDDPS